MRAFLAIAKITFLSSVRSRIFQFLLATLLFCVFLIPLSVEGDGTLIGHFKISIEYSLGAVGFILTLSSLWVSCYVMAIDLEGYQAHLVFVKPVRRCVVWLGKFAGVLLLHVILLAISATLIYVLIFWRLNNSSFPQEEVAQLKREVLVGREVYPCQIPDISEEVKLEVERQINRMKAEGLPIYPETRRTVRRDAIYTLLGREGEVQGDATKIFRFRGLPVDPRKLSLRYRAYVGNFEMYRNRKQESLGQWRVREVKEETAEDGHGGTFVDLTGEIPIVTNEFKDIEIKPRIVTPEGSAEVSFTNLRGVSVIFQLSESPLLLAQASSFLGNYARAVLMILARIFLVAGIACALGGFFSMPIAIFMVASYIIFGSLSSYILFQGSDLAVADEDTVVQFQESAQTKIGRQVGKILLMFITPMQKFEVADKVSSGMLIEWSFILGAVVNYILLKGTPVFLLGTYLYSVRELGLVTRK